MRNQTYRSIVAATLGLGVFLAGAAQAGTVETRTPFGRIEMVEEVRRRDPGEPPIMHVATEWTRLHLRWRSLDGVVALDVVDDGWRIKANIEVRIGQASCLSSADYLQYSGVAGEYDIAGEVRALIARLPTSGCAFFSREASAGYVRTLADGVHDFAVAEDGLRARAGDLFKRPPTRCLVPLPSPRPKKGQPEIFMALDPFELPPCRKVG